MAPAEGSSCVAPKVEGTALGWLHRAATTSLSQQWKDNKPAHPWPTKATWAGFKLNNHIFVFFFFLFFFMK